ncbi:endonuclease/exonuclease/phosphatase family protein [Spongiibacter sp.]|uniref:endonuclease/exonuclease/phosphatase family protein n=1 Tax=Spongiibacter sp. TaxID=2024860 RepID=UPI00356288DF
MTTVMAVLTLLCVLACLLPALPQQHWWVRGFDFPRLQIAVLAALLLLSHGVLLDTSRDVVQAMIGVTAACLVYQLWWIIPYSVFFPKEVPDARGGPRLPRLRLMTANVLTPNRNAEALLALVERYRPDVLVTLESDDWWQQQLDRLSPDYPHSMKCPQDNLYGMHVYSRWPLIDPQIEFLVEDAVPSMHALLQMPGGTRLRMHFLHPAPPSPTENEESAERDAELMVVAKKLEGCREPVIVTGDLNDVAWSRTTRLFRKKSGLLDPRVGRGMYNTYHADYPFFRWPLDHVFHSSHFAVCQLRRLPGFGSDHFALFSELALVAERVNDEQGLQADADTDRQVDALIAQQDVSVDDVPKPGS